MGKRSIDDADIRDIERQITEAIEVTRNLARGLTLIEPGEQGLIDGLQELVNNTARVSGIQCSFLCGTDVHIPDDAIAQHLYYVALEAVTNAVRHGEGSRIKVELTAEGTAFFLEVRDDGNFSGGEPTSGIGLRTMDYRARLFGGFITLTREDEWTVLRCRMNLGADGSH
jgi:signal transduction histidine kinase